MMGSWQSFSDVAKFLEKKSKEKLPLFLKKATESVPLTSCPINGDYDALGFLTSLEFVYPFDVSEETKNIAATLSDWIAEQYEKRAQHRYFNGRDTYSIWDFFQFLKKRRNNSKAFSALLDDSYYDDPICIIGLTRQKVNMFDRGNIFKEHCTGDNLNKLISAFKITQSADHEYPSLISRISVLANTISSHIGAKDNRLFARQVIQSGKIFTGYAKARLSGVLLEVENVHTILQMGRWATNAKDMKEANAELALVNGELYLKSMRDIKPEEEIFVAFGGYGIACSTCKIKRSEIRDETVKLFFCSPKCQFNQLNW